MMLSVSLSHSFPDFTLDATFTAPPGVTALFGRSGSGKTTVINAVAGLVRTDRGRVACGDVVLTDTDAGVMLPPHRRRLGYVFQESRLLPHLTVRQNLLYGRWFAPSTPGTEIDRIVDLLGIEALLHRRPGALSGGERQRVAIGRAILSNPRMLLMDEPLAALDEARKAEILPYLERLRDDLAVPILYVSHSVAEVARLATTVILMEAGRVAAIGAASDVLADPAVAPAIGLREAGSLLEARLVAQEADGLSRLETGGGPVWVPRVPALPGRTLRLRILAQDVMLALQRPQDISALNILSASVVDIRPGEGPGAMVRLKVGESRLLARVTKRSVQGLGLQPGQPVFAVLKAVSIAQGDVGSGPDPAGSAKEYR